MTNTISAYEKIKSGLITQEEVNKAVTTAIANRPLYKKLPSHILVEEFLVPKGMEVRDVIYYGKIGAKTMHGFMHGQIKIDTNLATKFGRVFNTSPDYWLNLQKEFDLKGTL